MTAHVAALLALALALSMDAVAAALGRGACARARPGWGAALCVGGAFGLAQAVMPLIGWSLGLAFASVIRDVDHWIAFVLLAAIGGRMVAEGLKAPDADPCGPRVASAGGWALFAAAMATSVDAAAAGVTLPLLALPVLVGCTVIGATTFLLSTGGVLLGRAVGERLGRRAEILGGIVLICLGFKILFEHLFQGG